MLLYVCAARVVDDTQLEQQLRRGREWCLSMRKTYGITPGRSFGRLPQELHAQYLSARCHVFFCKPHPMAGRGVYDCEPLEGSGDAGLATSAE